MEVIINGETKELAESTTLAQVLEQYRIKAGSVVVEVNLDIIPRDQLGGIVLKPGDRVEIVRLVGGG